MRLDEIFNPVMESDDEYNNHRDHSDALNKTGFWGKAGAGCIFLARSTGRILLNHRSADVLEPGTWGVWGGAIDRGEDPADAVRREVREEAGYHGTYDMVPLYMFESGTFRYYNFLVEVDEEFDPSLDWETQGYEWCEFGQWPSPMHFGLKALLSDAPSVKTIKAAIAQCASPVDESTGPISSVHGPDLSRFQMQPPPVAAEAYYAGQHWIAANKGAPLNVRHNECPYAQNTIQRIWWFKGAAGV